MIGVGRTMRFAEGVSASNQGDGFFVIHRHAAEGIANVSGGAEWIWLTIGAFRVHIYEAHLHCTEWIFELSITTVAFISEPFTFGSPIDIFTRLPDVGSATRKTPGLESHGFQCAIASEYHQVGP